MGFSFHPLAELFPLIEGGEFDALVADIKDHGLQQPIILYRGQILDGRNRYRACLKAKIEVVTREYEGNDPAAFVVSVNVNRRHLTIGQRAMIAAKIANIQRGAVGRNHPASDNDLSSSEAGALLNVSADTVFAARRVLAEAAPEEIAAIEEGKLGVQTVVRQIRAGLSKEQRSKQRNSSIVQSGKNPERIQRQQINALIWGQVRDSIINLTGLPAVSDVVPIVRANDRARLVDARLLQALKWLEDFSDAWTRNSEQAAE